MSEILKISDQVFELARKMRLMTSERLDLPGMTPGRLRALRRLDQGGPMRMGELAELLSIAPRSVTDFVDDLVTAGLVARVPDPEDRRATLIETTPKGQKILKKATRARQEAVAELFGALSETQLQELSRLLARVQDDRTF